MPWQKKASAPAGVTLTIGEAAAVWADAPSWIIGSIPGLNAGSEYVNLTDFCHLGPPKTIQAPWDAGSLVFPASLLEYAEAKLREKLFAHYCEYNGAPIATVFGAWCTPNGGPRNIIDGFSVPVPMDYLGVRHASGLGGGGHTLYWSNTPGQFQNNVAGGGSNMLDADGVAWWAWPWSSDRVMIWANNDYGPGECFEFAALRSGSYAPPAVATPPEGFIGPVAGLYPDLDAIGRALDALMQAAMQNAARLGALDRLLDPDAPVTVTTTEDVDPDNPAQKPAGAVGLIVTVSNMSPETDEVFGAPPVLHRLGFLVVGDGTAWHEPMELTANPFLLMPLPPGCESVSVILRTPAHATITWIKPAAGPIA